MLNHQWAELFLGHKQRSANLSPHCGSAGLRQILYEKIDVDNNQDLSIKYGVRNVPTLVLVENKEAIGRLVGVQSKEAILEFYNR